MGKLLLSLCLSLLLPFCAISQQGNTFNLNLDNGLPDNHVYGTIIDSHGYLWIATTNGVIRYNGYDFKIFTTEDGLPLNDVWQLIEDAKGRIWLGSIANHMGYIYNEKFYNAIFANSKSYTVYPKFMRLNGGHINFFSKYSDQNAHEYYFVERNDTLFDYSLPDKIQKYVSNIPLRGQDVENITPSVNEDGNSIIIYKNYVYNFQFINNQIKITSDVKVDSTNLNNVVGGNNFFLIDKYIVLLFYDYQNHFDLFNVYTGIKESIFLKDIGINEDIIQLYNNGSDNTLAKNFFIYTKNYIIEYELKGKLRHVSTRRIGNELHSQQIDGHKLTSFIYDKFWGYLIGTSTAGLTINYDTDKNYVRCTNIDLIGYKYLGGDVDNAFWVNDSNNLCTINSRLQESKVHIIDDQEMLYMALRKDEDNYFLMGKNCYIYNVHTKRAAKCDVKVVGASVFKSIKDEDIYYCISNGGFYAIKLGQGTKLRNNIDYDRYRDLVYDSLRHTYWAYNHNKIVAYIKGRKTVYSQQQLAQFGMQRVEKIVMDNKYGNIFFKGNERITVYDIEKNKYSELFTYLNLKEANMHIYKDILIVYGKFGILFSKLHGKRGLSKPIYYRNIKNAQYKFIYDAQFSFGKVILSTNNGTYAITIPEEDSLYTNSTNNLHPPHKFIYYAQNATVNLNHGDTIKISQKNLHIRLDLVNPYGNGLVKYVVTAQDIITELNANEYNIPSQLQSPDNYYTIEISASDKIWRSEPLRIVIYIEPYWWQTKNMRIIIWTATILLIILLFTVAILVTRRMVLNASQKKNMRMELELKAIYAQINPHFIFNSLNSALLLVSKNKMEDAYTHISKFSRLLRSYIKSSRNKFISVEEEITNLKNYVELQQIRFKDRFNYDIIVDNETFDYTVKIPSLLLQPFVENAIEHGLLNNKEIGNLLITFRMPNSKTLICVINDDGIGREESKKISSTNNTKEGSYGDLLIKDLVNIFNKYENVNVSIDYEDKVSPQTGTIVTIVIKYFK